MQLGMMQPYFFPYLGYFALIAATDRWVVFDTAQYIRRGWMNRNRVLSTGSAGWKYVRIPTAGGSRSQRICEVRIADRCDWRDDVLRNLDCYRIRRAPYFEQTEGFLNETFSGCGGSVCDAVVHCLAATCRHVGLTFRYERFSELPGDFPAIADPGEWALEAARALAADAYVNPPGGRRLFDAAAFAAAGVSLRFLTHHLPEYDQRQPGFIPGLSIVDVLMWNGSRRTRELIDSYDIETATPDSVSQAA